MRELVVCYTERLKAWTSFSRLTRKKKMDILDLDIYYAYDNLRIWELYGHVSGVWGRGRAVVLLSLCSVRGARVRSGIRSAGMEIKMMTQVEAEAARVERLNEKGTLPACPFCGKPRVQRSNYIRCNPCGVNWMDGENIDKNPSIERKQKFMASITSKGAEPRGTES